MTVLIDRLFEVHDRFRDASIPHAFGGAIALAYFTADPRGTRDLDINVFVGGDRIPPVLDQLPDRTEITEEDRRAASEVGQVRVMLDETPLDLFFNNLPFHDVVARDTRTVPLQGREIPVLGPASLIVFKAMFDRTKDWADIEGVIDWDPAPARIALDWIIELIGRGDPITRRLAALIGSAPDDDPGV